MDQDYHSGTLPASVFRLMIKTVASIDRQLTLRAVILGIVLSILLGAANAYLGLLVGLTVSASIPAAVVSMAILRILGNSSALENNIVQTAASSGEALAAGAIFTLPALVLMGYWSDFEYFTVVGMVAVGGLLGVLLTIPLRHAMVGNQTLIFPEGQATAKVLKVAHSAETEAEQQQASSAVRLMLLGVLAGAVAKLCSSGLKLWNNAFEWAQSVGQSALYFGGYLSPALLGVGYIVGLNIALLVFAGGVFSWMIAVPLLTPEGALAANGGDAYSLAWKTWSGQVRYLGVGAMLVGGLWALFSLRGDLFVGIRQALSSGNGGTSGKDIPAPLILGIAVVLALPMGWGYASLIGTGPAVPLTVIMLAAAFLFSSVAAYMAGLVGSSNNPISGVTIATILLTALGLYAALGEIPAGPVTAILVGAVVCCAAAIGGDNMQDLKAGQILGATPWKQQVAQMIGVLAAALVIAPVISLLLRAYGIGPATAEMPNALPAPQATLMASVATGVFGGNLPWDMVAIGALIAVVVIAADVTLQRRGSTIRLPVLAVAVGIYLPMKYTVPIALGGVVAWLATRSNASAKSIGMLGAAGLITGEALMGIALAMIIIATGQKDVLALADATAVWPGLLVMAGLAFWLYRQRDTGTGEPNH